MSEKGTKEPLAEMVKIAEGKGTQSFNTDIKVIKDCPECAVRKCVVCYCCPECGKELDHDL